MFLYSTKLFIEHKVVRSPFLTWGHLSCRLHSGELLPAICGLGRMIPICRQLEMWWCSSTARTMWIWISRLVSAFHKTPVLSTVLCRHGWKWFMDTLPVVSIQQHVGRRRFPSSQLDDDQSHTDGNEDDKTNSNAHQDQKIKVWNLTYRPMYL